jgi:hypothetical protein
MFGSVGFYVIIWIPTLDTEPLGTLIRLIIVGVFGFILLDHINRTKQAQNRLNLLMILAISLLILCLLVFNIARYQIPVSIADNLVQICIMFATLFVGLSYWNFLSANRAV